eukprot:725679_1
MDNNVNNISNLSIFEDYEFNINSQTNTANLIIRFIEILHAEYQIEFSFKNLTLSPTQSPTQQTTNPTINPTQTPTQQTQIPSTNPTNMPTINDLLSTDVFESINEQNEITIFKGMTMSYSVMLGLFIGIGIIILMTMFVCILLCCVILRQKRKYKEKVGEIERIQSVPTLSPGFIPTITKLGSFGSIKDVPPIPIQAIPSNENHYETNQIQIEMSPKSVSN